MTTTLAGEATRLLPICCRFNLQPFPINPPSPFLIAIRIGGYAQLQAIRVPIKSVKPAVDS